MAEDRGGKPVGPQLTKEDVHRLVSQPQVTKLVERYFTTEGKDIKDYFEVRDDHSAEIRNAEDEVVFVQEDIEAPAFFTRKAVAIIAQKYFSGSPETYRESSVFDMVYRVAGTIAAWGGFRCKHGDDINKITSNDPDIDRLGMEPCNVSRTGGVTWAVCNRPMDWNDEEPLGNKAAEIYFESYEEWRTFLDELQYMLLEQRFWFNSPVWFNLGVSLDPDKRVDPSVRAQASACFINDIEDDMGGDGGHGILDIVITEGKIFKNGSGSGTNLSKIRSSKEWLSNGGRPSGPMSFSKGYDSFAGVIKSGGKTRRAAIMRELDIDHPDIRDFIGCKSREEKKARILIAAGYDDAIDGEAYSTVAYQNANWSVHIPDAFMQAAERDIKWPLIARTSYNLDSPTATNMLGQEMPIIEDVWASKLLQEIAKQCWNSGDPGVQFHDTMNHWHTCKASGKIRGTNPCSEYVFLHDTSCNLGSTNLARFFDPMTNSFDQTAYEHVIRAAIVAMDILVSFSSYPSKHITRGTKMFRTLGLGYANLGTMIMTAGLPYDSPEARDLASAVTSFMTSVAYHQSAKLGELLGPFPAIDDRDETGTNRGHMAEVMAHHLNAAMEVDAGWSAGPAFNNFKGLLRDSTKIWSVAEKDYRNAQVTVIAPTGTISFAMDCSTTGCEPLLSLLSFKSMVGGGTLTMTIPEAIIALKKLGYDERKVGAITSYIEARGHLEGCPEISSERHLSVFDPCFSRPYDPKAEASDKDTRWTTRSIPWKGHVDMLAAIQPFISGASSRTINMPFEATPEEMEEAYTYAWKKGLKCVAAYRDRSKANQPLKTVRSEGGYENIATRRPLPTDRKALTHKFVIGTESGYITRGFYEDGTLGEIFVKFSKYGPGVQGWIEVWNIAMSYCLQYGVPLKKLVKKFAYMEFEPRGFTKNTDIRLARSIVDYVVRFLAVHHLSDVDRAWAGLPMTVQLEAEKKGEKAKEEAMSLTPVAPIQLRGNANTVCPICGSMNVNFQGNTHCLQCGDCGWQEGGCAG
jgi:ribonucleoside-diphosphate reductase alpha chain